MGDFNSAEDALIVRYLQGQTDMEVGGEVVSSSSSRQLVDTFRLTYPGAKILGTAAPFDRGRLPQKFDYIFFGHNQWTIEPSAMSDDKLGGRFPSDHRPVIVDVSWVAEQHARHSKSIFFWAGGQRV